MRDTDQQRAALASFNFSQSYARYNRQERRRETWEEAVARVMDMHRAHLAARGADLPAEQLERVQRAYESKRILGSQRSLQFGGEAVLHKHPRAYNCTVAHVDTPRRFAEALYLLLCGAGVGYSVQAHHVRQLPSVASLAELGGRPQVTHVIGDSIEAWARALDALVECYMGQGPVPCFDFSRIRERGSEIKSCGGKAPGPFPLRVMLAEAEALLRGRAGQALRPVDASDLMCVAADCVRAGGVRRAALIALFDLTDEEMLGSKSTDNWWGTHPWRARANISALALRPRAQEPEYAAQVRAIFERTKVYGEPGIIWVDSLETAFNPCVEIGMVPTLIKDARGKVLDEYAAEILDHRRRAEWEAAGLSFESAWQFCNLTEVNAAAWSSVEEAREAVELATLLGCVQAGYTLTDDDFLVAGGRTCTREILEREYLLGVSLTGLGSAAAWVREERLLRMLGEHAADTARRWWAACGLKRCPARVTCVKPSGNAAVLLGCASGVHADHAPRFLRRVQASTESPITRAYLAANPLAGEPSVWSRNGTDYALSFAVQAPDGALLKSEQTAQEFLEWVALVQRSWVLGGTVRHGSAGPVRHNVSNTCVVRPEEWDGVIETLSTRPYEFGGVSCLGASGDYDYPQAPFTRVYEPREVSEDDPHRASKLAAWELWNALRVTHTPVDYSQVREDEDNTEVMGEVACAGGACELKL